MSAEAIHTKVSLSAHQVEQSLHNLEDDGQGYSTATTVEVDYYEEKMATRQAVGNTISDVVSTEDKVLDTNSRLATVHPVLTNDMLACSPAPIHVSTAIERNESRNLRRFRMFSAFCVLFLAGWK